MSKKLIAIVGPTASGKTGIGVRLAKELGGEIVSADSRQVYRELNLGTGKEGSPCQELSSVNDQLSVNYQLNNFSINRLNENDKLKIDHLRRNRRCVENIPQWLVDIVEPRRLPPHFHLVGGNKGDRFTLFDWLPLARLAIEDIFSRGKVPIVVGGTGLYIQGLIEGFTLEENPNNKCQTTNKKNVISNKALAERGEVRNLQVNKAGDFSSRSIDSRNDSHKKEIKELRLILQQIDPVACDKVDLNNPHRLIRAIERAEQGLKPTKIRPDFEVLQIGIDLPRDELYQRIDRRVEERFKAGMLEEVEKLVCDGVDPQWLIKLGLEYKLITEFIVKIAKLLNYSPHPNPLLKEERMIPFPFLREKVRMRDNNEAAQQFNNEFELMKQQLKYKIHAFARRQLTWFRRFPEITWLRDYQEIRERAQSYLFPHN